MLPFCVVTDGFDLCLFDGTSSTLRGGEVSRSCMLRFLPFVLDFEFLEGVVGLVTSFFFSLLSSLIFEDEVGILSFLIGGGDWNSFELPLHSGDWTLQNQKQIEC